eukprot:5182461-Prymnesium_polylepis.2
MPVKDSCRAKDKRPSSAAIDSTEAKHSHDSTVCCCLSAAACALERSDRNVPSGIAGKRARLQARCGRYARCEALRHLKRSKFGAAHMPSRI